MAAQMMSVQVKESPLRAVPSFLGKIVATGRYGDRVSVLAEKSGWVQITLPASGHRGWMHRSGLTTKRIVLKAGAEDVAQAATDDELALAGKGFNQAVENAFRAKNPDLDFTWIDRMEGFAVSQEQMVRFLRDGAVNPKGGIQ